MSVIIQQNGPYTLSSDFNGLGYILDNGEDSKYFQGDDADIFIKQLRVAEEVFNFPNPLEYLWDRDYLIMT